MDVQDHGASTRLGGAQSHNVVPTTPTVSDAPYSTHAAADGTRTGNAHDHEVSTATNYLPDHPGSAPSMTFNSTNLFAFGTSPSCGFFNRRKDEYSEDMQTDLHVEGSNVHAATNVSSNNDENDTDSCNTDPSTFTAFGDSKNIFGSNAIPSSVPSRRKNSIEMFLSQSPSQALGGEFMKLNFKETSISSPNSVSKSSNLTSKRSISSPVLKGYGCTFQETGIVPHQFHSMPDISINQSTAMFSPSRSMTYDSNDCGTSIAYQGNRDHHNFVYDLAENTVNGSAPIPPHPTSGVVPPLVLWANPASSIGIPVQNGGLQPPLPPVMHSHVHPPFQLPPHHPHGYSMHIPAHVHGHNYHRAHSSGYGDNISPPPSPENSMNPNKSCKFFIQGHCRMGNKCKFLHVGGKKGNTDIDELARVDALSSSSTASSTSTSPLPANEKSMQRSSIRRPTPPSNVKPQSNGLIRKDGMDLSDVVLNGGIITVEDIKGRVFTMSKDQNGCRLLQEQLDQDDNGVFCRIIFEESLENLSEMMVDPFGNYLFQKLLEQATEEQRTEIVRRVSSNLVPAALNLHGTRSVQKVVEVCVSNVQVQLIIQALRDDAVRLCIDSNGNHVIQRTLQFMSPEDNQFVFEAVSKECTTVGTHRHGCCVLQRCLDAANPEQKRVLIKEVEKHAMKLMQDPYGNYVVQYVLDSCTPVEASGVIMKPLGMIYELSIQKFSSNVIEKCLEKASSRTKVLYLDEIMHCPKMPKMLQDQFANYVVQRALSVCTDEQGMLLVNAIRPHLASMKNTSGGRRITARILKRFPHIPFDIYVENDNPSNSSSLMTSSNRSTFVNSSIYSQDSLYTSSSPSSRYSDISSSIESNGSILPSYGLGRV